MTASSCNGYYVILTGSKNNAGDYLIKYRAIELLNILRPDRKIIDYDGWVKFDKKKIRGDKSIKGLNPDGWAGITGKYVSGNLPFG